VYAASKYLCRLSDRQSTPVHRELGTSSQTSQNKLYAHKQSLNHLFTFQTVCRDSFPAKTCPDSLVNHIFLISLLCRHAENNNMEHRGFKPPPLTPPLSPLQAPPGHTERPQLGGSRLTRSLLQPACCQSRNARTRPIHPAPPSSLPSKCGGSWHSPRGVNCGRAGRANVDGALRTHDCQSFGKVVQNNQNNDLQINKDAYF